MKRFLTITVAISIGIVLCDNVAFGYYYNVDAISGGPVENEWLSLDWTEVGDGTSILNVQGRGTNMGATALTDVGVTWQFFYYPQTEDDLIPYIYDNSTHRWNWPSTSHWAESYLVEGQNDLLSMSRSVTDVPLEWDGATLEETDDVSVIWLASSLLPGESIEYTVHFHLNNQKSAAAVGFFVSTVPEPATLLLLGLGGFMLRRKRRAK